MFYIWFDSWLYHGSIVSKRVGTYVYSTPLSLTPIDKITITSSSGKNVDVIMDFAKAFSNVIRFQFRTT